LINLSIENIVFSAEPGRRGQKLFEKLGNNVKPQSQMLSGFHGNTLWSAEELIIKTGSTELITVLQSLRQKLLYILEFPSFKSIIAVTHV